MSNAECVKRWQQKQKDRLVAAEAEVTRLRSLDHAQILADSAARKLLAGGAENYVGDVFTITVDNGEAFEIVVTTQRVGAKSPHELHAEASAKLEDAERRIRKEIADGLLSSAFLHCDVDKEDVLLCIEHGPGTLSEIKARLAKCCVPTAVEEALLAAGEYTPEELWGGREPSCPKCIGSKRRD